MKLLNDKSKTKTYFTKFYVHIPLTPVASSSTDSTVKLWQVAVGSDIVFSTAPYCSLDLG